MEEQLSFIPTPVMEFESDEHLQRCIEEWKEVLFLNDWIIKGVLVDHIENEHGEEFSGQNSFQIVNKCGLVKVVKATDENKAGIMKYCGEQIVVHELLHCKYNWVERDYDSIEVAYYDELEHGLIEQMAKSLIMVKYKLPFKWFMNFEQSSIQQQVL